MIEGDQAVLMGLLGTFIAFCVICLVFYLLGKW